MKLKKGSIEAKRFMAKIRAKKKSTKKAPVKKAKVKKAPVKKMSLHKDTASHNVKISVLSGLKKPTKAQDYNIDKYINLQREVFELQKFITENKKTVKKLTGMPKKLKLMDINIAYHELNKAKMTVQSFKKFYKTL